MHSPDPPPAFAAAPSAESRLAASAGKPAPPALRIAAWLTHVYTATGALLALLATSAIVRGDLRFGFFWLAISIVVDSTDGFLARAFRVREVVPDVNGSHLDDIVDYLTFVFVPAFLMYHAGRLPPGWALPVVFAMLVSSVVAFAKADAKSADHFFTGFPSYWNIVVLYLVGLGVAPWLNAVILLALCGLIFVRIGYVYPSRTPTLRALTVTLGCGWGAVLIYEILRFPRTDAWLVVSLVFPAYYVVLSLVLHARRK